MGDYSVIFIRIEGRTLALSVGRLGGKPLRPFSPQAFTLSTSPARPHASAASDSLWPRPNRPETPR